MEENDDRKRSGVGGRSEDANREIARGIDSYVEGENAMDGFHRIGRGSEIEETEEAAVDGTV